MVDAPDNGLVALYPLTSPFVTTSQKRLALHSTAGLCWHLTVRWLRRAVSTQRFCFNALTLTLQKRDILPRGPSGVVCAVNGRCDHPVKPDAEGLPRAAYSAMRCDVGTIWPFNGSKFAAFIRNNPQPSPAA
jgi:hypothetical protein